MKYKGGSNVWKVCRGWCRCPIFKGISLPSAGDARTQRHNLLGLDLQQLVFEFSSGPHLSSCPSSCYVGKKLCQLALLGNRLLFWAGGGSATNFWWRCPLCGAVRRVNRRSEKSCICNYYWGWDCQWSATFRLLDLSNAKIRRKLFASSMRRKLLKKSASALTWHHTDALELVITASCIALMRNH